MKYDLRWAGTWVAWILFGFIFEFVSLLDHNPTTPPLTQVILWLVPRFIGVGFFAWLFTHFLIRYFHFPWQFLEVGRRDVFVPDTDQKRLLFSGAKKGKLSKEWYVRFV